MNAPMMMLPWLARKWGISDARALELWQQACEEAKASGGNTPSSRYWEIAKTRLLDLLDHEVIFRYPGVETPGIMIQLNLLRMMCWINLRLRRFSVAMYA